MPTAISDEARVLAHIPHAGGAAGSRHPAGNALTHAQFDFAGLGRKTPLLALAPHCRNRGTLVRFGRLGGGGAMSFLTATFTLNWANTTRLAGRQIHALAELVRKSLLQP